MDGVFDFAVIGGGVVGIAITRQLTLSGGKCVLLEKAPDLLDGASKANSAIMHTGFDAPNGSIEQNAIALGYKEYHKIHQKLGLPPTQKGALLIAYNHEEYAQFEGILAKAKRNGVDDLSVLDQKQIAEREPHLTPNYLAGILIPGEGFIDPWSAPLAYAEMARQNGAEILREWPVNALDFDGKIWTLRSKNEKIRARHVINCAGLYSDKIDEMATHKKRFDILPRKGQFLVLDKQASKYINHILLSVPTKITKGILISKTAFGNVIIGPTAQTQTSRSEAFIEPEIQEILLKTAIEHVPAFESIEVTSNYVGLRPATNHSEYQLHFDDEINYTCVGGIRSTGLSSALGLGILVAKKIARGYKPIKSPIWPQANQISEFGSRDYQKPGNDGIICHCEYVTKREIQNTLNAPFAPNSLAGLKRQTRVTMGRCQGFYCTCALAELTEGKLKHPVLDSKREAQDEIM